MWLSQQQWTCQIVGQISIGLDLVEPEVTLFGSLEIGRNINFFQIEYIANVDITKGGLKMRNVSKVNIWFLSLGEVQYNKALYVEHIKLCDNSKQNKKQKKETMATVSGLWVPNEINENHAPCSLLL